MKNAKTLREMVIDNALTLGRLSQETLGKDDYKEMTKLYNDALDAITEWASKDYAHTSTVEDRDNCFNKVKAILDLYTTDDDRIIIDDASMRSMRDCATKPKRFYSKEYAAAEKARKEQDKTAKSRYEDLLTLGCPEIAENEKTEEYVARVRESGIDTNSMGVDMLMMYENAMATLAVKTKKVEDIKKAGNWTWRRAAAVNVTIFADLIENYIADCLIDCYNLKPTAKLRAEQAERRAAAKAEKNK